MNINSRQHRAHDISPMIGTAHRGHRYGSEAIRWILNWGFQSAGLHRIGIEDVSYNTAAIRLWKNLGFKEDGRVREALWSNGGWHDSVILSMLEGEWRALVAGDEGESDD
jgi:RimJ/RimL family protein N-acetyltransferase